MDDGKYTTLVEALAEVPDPRKARGQRYPWILLLTLVSAALVSGNPSGRAIGRWVKEHAETLAQELDRAGRSLPSESTLRRALRGVDVAELEERIKRSNDTPREPQPERVWEGVAVDGKEVGGARAHGRVVHLVSAVRHDGVVLNETAVENKSNEITAAPSLRHGFDRHGKVVTVDALLAQRALARQIREQGGHYLMVIKEDQPETDAAIKLLFDDPPEGKSAAETTVRTISKGHGRREWRTLVSLIPLIGLIVTSGAVDIRFRQCWGGDPPIAPFRRSKTDTLRRLTRRSKAYSPIYSTKSDEDPIPG